jgi:hypothetical protein
MMPGRNSQWPSYREKHGKRGLAAYKGKKVDIEFEWGDSENRKLLHLSIPGPTVSL